MRKIEFMKNKKDILIVGVLLIAIIAINIFLDVIIPKKDKLTIIKEKIENTSKIVVSTGDIEELKDNDIVRDYYNNKHRVIKVIEDEEEIKKIKESMFTMYEPDDNEIFTDSYSLNLFQFYDKNNRKICEYNFQYIMIGYNTKIRVRLEKNLYQKYYNDLLIYSNV